MRRLMILLLAMAILLSGCTSSPPKNNSLPATTGDSSLIVSDEPSESLEVEIPAPIEPFDPLLYSGSEDKIITDIDLPDGIFISKIEIDSTSHYAVKFHHDDTYELLVNNSKKPYSGVTLTKDNEIASISGGMLEITSGGDWNITIDRLSGETTKNIAGHGDKVTGFFPGNGKKEVVTLDIDSTAHYSIKLFEYNIAENTLTYDLLVNDSGEPYHGEKIADLKEGLQYFFVVDSEGDWSIDFGTEDDITEYYDTSSSENTVTKVLSHDSLTAEQAYNKMQNVPLSDLEVTPRGTYRYGVWVLSEESVSKIGGNVIVNKGMMYNEIGWTLSLYCDFGTIASSQAATFFKTVVGEEVEPDNWPELAPILYEFIHPNPSEADILKAIEPLTSVEGSFDYDSRNYDFQITDLTNAANELQISEEMLGYVIAKLSEYPAQISFSGNTLTCSLTIKTYN